MILRCLFNYNCDTRTIKFSIELFDDHQVTLHSIIEEAVKVHLKQQISSFEDEIRSKDFMIKVEFGSSKPLDENVL